MPLFPGCSAGGTHEAVLASTQTHVPAGSSIEGVPEYPNGNGCMALDNSFSRFTTI